MSMPTQTTKELVRYTVTPDDIHIYEILDGSRGAIDLWLEKMSELPKLYNDSGRKTPVCVMVDNRTVAQSAFMTYSFQAVQRWLKENPRQYVVCVAVIMGNNALISVADLLLRSMRYSDTITRLFRSSDYDKALDWLKKMSETTL